MPNPDADGEWLMDKVGAYSSPLDQVDGSGKGLSYVTSGLAYVTAAQPPQTLVVESLDAGLVRWGAPMPFPTPLRGNVSLAEGASFVLFENVWNTNFLFWWPYVGAAEATPDGLHADAVFRWRFHLP